MSARPRRSAEPGHPWCTGWARYEVERPFGKSRVVVAARCRVDGIDTVEQALLDTGAQWSLIGGELAELVRPIAVHLELPPLPFTTRLGTLSGSCVRIPIVLVADEGEDLVVESTVYLMPQWTGPSVVLGYRGLLERVRLAFDPGVADDQWLGFGGYGV